MALSAARRQDRCRHIITTAQALIRDRGDAGFSMTELAARAGVSPATPYNLVGSKADILRLVVKEEFASFIARLATVDHESPLSALLDATALVVTHYEADRQFYQALYLAAFNAEATDVHDLMQAEGRALWRKLVQAAVDCGDLSAMVRVEPFTDVILRTLSAVTMAWLSERWDHARFELEMSLSTRLVVASVARPDLQPRFASQLARLQDALHALTPSLEAAEVSSATALN